MSDNAVELTNVSMAFGDIQVLEDFSLHVRRNELLVLCGPSGCGKSTILSLLSGGQRPSRGHVARAGRARTVFQQDGLFPWRTVAQNVELGVREIRDGAERSAHVDKVLRLVSLEKFRNLYPHQLSGGMRQRAELARSLVGGTDALLLDEPFSGLDYLARRWLRDELLRVLASAPRTAAVLVTHDVEEAVYLADRLAVLSPSPARLQLDVRPDFPKPRDPADSRSLRLIEDVMSALGRSFGPPATWSTP
jgi:NitT/TauT family transport system ATP-binding protein